MAKLRKFSAYQTVERPYTRHSKYKVKNFVRSRPVNRIVRFVMGSRTKTFKHKLQLVSNQRMQMRDNAIEAARQTCNRLLELEFIANYRFMIHVFPHHILRENPLSAGAGADRMSTGMAHSFGKNIGIAAQVKKGKVIFSVQFNENPEIVKVALKRAAAKLPCKCLIR